ncbi:calcium-binding protein [Paraburkholderia edwinii]|uniref:Calcium-binding protein n=1 Tax=Paraburkholderia edwinii TaxID=2861782 RepID=A0ABX8UWG9_9BURK|nr:calcium-binding protein [Paraburkholderia edwinii]QYD71682.1 calcium-binding protein [Paraburkholderia edwinii]
MTVQTGADTGGLTGSVSIGANGTGSLSFGGQSIFSFGAGSDISVNGGTITVTSSPSSTWSDTAQLDQSGLLTQTYSSTNSSGEGISLTYTSGGSSTATDGGIAQLTGVTIDGQPVGTTGSDPQSQDIYSGVQSTAQDIAATAAALAGSLLGVDQGAIASGNLSLASDPNGMVAALSSLIGSAETDLGLSNLILSIVDSTPTDIVALVPQTAPDMSGPGDFSYDPDSPTVPGISGGTVIVNNGPSSETLVGGAATSVTVDGQVWDATQPDDTLGDGGGEDSDLNPTLEDLLSAIFFGNPQAATSYFDALTNVGMFLGEGTAADPIVYVPSSAWSNPDGSITIGIPGLSPGSDGSGNGGNGGNGSGSGDDAGDNGSIGSDGGIFLASGGDDDAPTTIIIYVDPLVLSFNGQPISLLSQQAAQAEYGPQWKPTSPDTGWVGQGTGILAIDNDGVITVLSNFAALAALDVNHDGVVDASDPAYANLGIWDGLTGPGGFVLLSSIGIQSIGTIATATNQTVNGNSISAVGTVTFTGGATESIDDVTFTGSVSQVSEQGQQGESSAALAFYSRVLEYLPAKAEGTAQQIAQTVSSMATWASDLVAAESAANSGTDSNISAPSTGGLYGIGGAFGFIEGDTIAHSDAGSEANAASKGWLEDVNDITIVGGDTLVYNEQDPTYGTLLNLDYDHVYMLTSGGQIVYDDAAAVADVDAAASPVAQVLTSIETAALAVQAAATAQSNSESAAMAADTGNAALGSASDIGAAASAVATEQAWLTAFTYLATTLNWLPAAQQALDTAEAVLPEIELPAGAHYLTTADAQEAVGLLSEQSQLTQSLAQGTAAFETLLAAVAQAWNVSQMTIASPGTSVQALGGDLVLAAAGAETVRDGATPSTYIVLPGAQVTINNFHAGLNGSRIDFLSPGSTMTVTDVAGGTQIQLGTATVLLTGVSASSLSYFDNIAGVSAVSANLNGATINLASNGSMIDDGTTHVDTLTMTGSADTLIANNGTDVLTATGSSNELIGGSGADMLNVSGSGNRLVAGSGTTELMVNGAGANNVLVGGAGTDEFAASSGEQQQDTLIATTGNDVMRLTGNSNTLIAGTGIDVLSVIGSSNTLIAGSGDDLLSVVGGGNLLEGGSYRAELVSDASGNTLVGGTGFTQAFYLADDLAVDLVAGKASINDSGVGDTLIDIVNADVTGSHDTLIAGAASGTLWAEGQADTVIAGAGDDVLISDMGGNTLVAGSGTAEAIYSFDHIDVDLATGVVSNLVGGGTSDTVIGITQVRVTGDDDVLVGTTNGADYLAAVGSNDTLVASGSGNTLTGGTAAVFVVNQAGGNTLTSSVGPATVSYAADGLTIDLANGLVTSNGTGLQDTLAGAFGIAQATGSADTLIGGAGASTLASSPAGNTLIAGTGKTAAYYGSDDITVDLGSGTARSNTGTAAEDALVGIADVIVAGADDTLLSSATGDDTLSAAGKNDTLIALGGGNTLAGGNFASDLIGNATGNTLIAGAGATTVTYGDGAVVDLGTGIASIAGSATHDVLSGIIIAQASGSHETLIGASTATTLIGDASHNTLVSGTGHTNVAYEQDGLTVNLASGQGYANSGSAASGDTLIGISTAVVAGNDDTLIGANGDVLINTSGENDTLIATGSGNTLEGGSGSSTLISLMANNTLIGGTGVTVADFDANGLSISLVSGKVNGAGASGVIEGITNVQINGNNNTLVGSAIDSVLKANGNDNTLISSPGAGDLLEALDGDNNTLVAVGRGQTLEGGAGSTTLISDATGNTLIGGAGRTVASYSGSSITVDMESGTAIVNGLSSGDTLIGITAVNVSGFDDTLIGSSKGGEQLGATGIGDTLEANGGGDVLVAGTGTSTLASNAAGNTLIGGAGVATAYYGGDDVMVNLASGMAGVAGSGITDTLVNIHAAQAGGSNDTLYGGAGVTTLGSNGQGNTLIAGTNRTVVSYDGSGVAVDLGEGTATVDGASTGDVLVGIAAGSVGGTNDTLIGAASGGDFLTATGAHDTVIAYGSGNTLEAGNGNDTLITNAAGNTLVGALASTAAIYAGNGLTVNLATGMVTSAGSSSGSVVGVADVIATGTGDVLIGGSGNDTLVAQGSHDVLEGGSGITTLIGSDNSDTLMAGPGLSVVDYAGIGTTVDLSTQRVSESGGGVVDTLVGVTIAEASGSGETLIGINSADSTLVGDALGNTLIGYETETVQTTAYYAGNDLYATSNAVKSIGSGVGDSLVGINVLELVGDNDTLNGSGSMTGDDDTLIDAGNNYGYEDSIIGDHNTLVTSVTGGSVTGNNNTVIGYAIVSGDDNVLIGGGEATSGNGNTIIASGSGFEQLLGGSGTTTLVGRGTGDSLLRGGNGQTVAAYASGMFVDLVDQLAEASTLWKGSRPASGQYYGDTLYGIEIGQADGTGNTLYAGENQTIGSNGQGNTLVSELLITDFPFPNTGEYVGGEAYFYADNMVVNGEVDNKDDGLPTGYAYSSSNPYGPEDAIYGYFGAYAVTGDNSTLMGGDTLMALGNNDTLMTGRVMEGGANTSTLIGTASTVLAGGTLIGGTGHTVATFAGPNTIELAEGMAWWTNGEIIYDETLTNITITEATGTGTTFIGNTGNSTLIGNLQGNELVAGSARTVAYYAGKSVDVLLGGPGQNGSASSLLEPGTTSDVLVGLSAADVTGLDDYVLGSASGGDLLVGEGTSDTIVSRGTGNTLLASGGSGNRLTGSGSDLLEITGGANNIVVSAGNSVLEAIGGASDSLVASHNDTLIGGAGTAVLVGNLEGNTLIAGSRQTEANFSGTANVVVDLATGLAIAPGGGADTLIGFSNVAIASANGTLIGSNNGGDYLQASGPGTIVLAAGTDNTLAGSTLISSSIGGNTLVGGTSGLLLRSAGLAYYSESFMTIDLNAGIASGFGRENDTLINVTSVETTGQDETLIGGKAQSTLISSQVGGNTLIAGKVATEAFYTENRVVVDLAHGVVSAAQSADDTLVGTFSMAGAGGTHDILIGGAGPTTLTSTGADNTLIAGSGKTTLTSTVAGNTLVAGAGATSLSYVSSKLVIDLADGLVELAGVSDTLSGVFAGATVQGSNNTLIGARTGSDQLTIAGAGSADTIVSYGGNNVLSDGSGTGTLITENVGGNTLTGSATTVADFAASSVTVNLATKQASVAGSPGLVDTLVGITIVEASGSHDTLIGTTTAGTLTSAFNNDTLIAGGKQTEVEYSNAGVVVDLRNGTASEAGASATDTLIGFTSAMATGVNDTLIGSDTGGDTLFGTFEGSDTLVGDLTGNTLVNGLAYFAESNLTVALNSGSTTVATAKAVVNGVTRSDTLVTVSEIEVAGNDDTVTATPYSLLIVATGIGDTLTASQSNLESDAEGNTLIASGATPSEVTAEYGGNGVTVNLQAGTAIATGTSFGDKLIGITDGIVFGEHDVVIAGTVANAVLESSGTNNTLVAGTGGGDHLYDAGLGYDYFDVGLGDGLVTISNGGETLDPAPVNELDFGPGIADSQLWLARSGNDLMIDVLGTTTRVDLSNWFTFTGNQLAKITAGGLAVDSQINQLVQAMATYSANTPGFNPATATQMPADSALEGAIAAAWHA